jgi:hypothetical protein
MLPRFGSPDGEVTERASFCKGAAAIFASYRRKLPVTTSSSGCSEFRSVLIQPQRTGLFRRLVA